MMMNRRLIGAVAESRKYIAGNVAFQWISLAANIVLMAAVARLLQRLYEGAAAAQDFARTAAVILCAVAVRFACTVLASRMSYLSARSVKKTLRGQIFRKLLRLGTAYRESVQTSEVVQVAVEGVDQLETYFGSYLPQLFYAMLAPLTLFAVLSFVSLPASILLLICVPLIPVTIVAVQRWAKRLLAKYWGQYTELGDTFLENLQGLTTTKLYRSDGYMQEKMNEQSERFRKITMKVLTMQLNSITVMDLIAYGGAALGAVLAVLQFRSGRVSLAGCLMILLLSADFFLPMRLLGSYFHIAKNGAAAANKIFRLLDLPEPEDGGAQVPEDPTIRLKNLHFSYEPGREILHGVDMIFPAGSFTAIAGESGCGKSTVAALIMGRQHAGSGSLTVGGVPLSALSERSRMENITYIGHQSYLFRGTVRENLLTARPDADDAALWAVLERVKLAGFLRSEQGLDTVLTEQGSNLSGGQRQRLALARALLHDSPVYIFDEATSNIDVESENDIMAEILRLRREKTVILISHRLAIVVQAQNIYMLSGGSVAGHGAHAELLTQCPAYARLWNAQQELERYRTGGDAE